MKLTSSQIQAIETSGSNILVSAGAGSGKTSVLKDRVIYKLKQGVHIDELIILTFTKAAAAEMKTRIINAIKENKELEPELNRIDQAVISTFDAFCLDLVKQYHYLLDLPRTINIGDNIQFLSMEQEVLEETIKSYYLSQDNVFEQMVLLLFQKGDSIVYDIVRETARGLLKQPDFEAAIQQFEERYFSSSHMEKMFYEYEAYLVEQLQYAKYKTQELIKALFGYSESVDNYLMQAENYFTKIEKYRFEDVYRIVIENDFPRKPSSRNDDVLKGLLTTYHDPIKAKLNEIKKVLCDISVRSREQAIKRVLSTKTNALKIVEIAKEYINALQTVKRRLSLFDFSDIMNLAISLFEEHEDIRLAYKEQIKEIMIDEYQDTNDIQDYFISLISDNNLFMVGDIKQSIYGFRDANPYNFQKRYLDYSQGIGGKLIVLRENFRSRKSILDDINNIFYNTMDIRIGGANYQDNQSLIYGYHAYDQKKPGQFYGIDLIKYDIETQRETEPELDYTTIEARLLAKDIRNKIDNHFKVLVSTGNFREMKYSDIAILIDRKTNFNRISEILSDYNIPVNLYSDEPFLNSPEMLFLVSYLKLINCYRDFNYASNQFKMVLYSVARSFVFKVPDEDIIHFLVNHETISHETLNELSIYQPFKDIYESIQSVLNYLDKIPMNRVLTRIYQDLDLYRKISQLDNPGKKEEKLDYFVETIKQFERFDFIQLIAYLDVLESNPDWDIDYSGTDPDKDAVKLMTMHKSKGLQFPVVYLPGLNKPFNFSENKNLYMFNKSYGLISPAFENGFIRTFPRQLYLNQAKTEYISERIRLFYVACTRAKEHLILFADHSDLIADMDVLQDNYVEFEIRNKYRKYTHLLSSTAIRNYRYQNEPKQDIVVRKSKEQTYDKLITFKKFNFQQTEVEQARFSKTTDKLLDDESIRNIQYGDLVHSLLEDIDFYDFESSTKNLPKKIKASVKKLLDSDLFDLERKPQIYREYEFLDVSNGTTRRGIIDLMLIYDDQIFIIDYKLKNIADDAYNAQLRAYKEYIATKTNKTVKTYLYSILQSELVEVC